MKNVFYPRLSFKAVGDLFLVVLLGALIAGIYGIIHDQITYTLSPEYFTQFKFQQFWDVDYGFGDRIFAGTIGFLATSWIGAILGWVVGRLAIEPETRRINTRLAVKGIALIFLITLAFGALSYIYATIRLNDVRDSWQDWIETYRITDMPAFWRVGIIHNSGYLGGVAGGILGVIWLLNARKRQSKSRQTD